MPLRPPHISHGLAWVGTQVSMMTDWQPATWEMTWSGSFEKREPRIECYMRKNLNLKRELQCALQNVHSLKHTWLMKLETFKEQVDKNCHINYCFAYFLNSHFGLYLITFKGISCNAVSTHARHRPYYSRVQICIFTELKIVPMQASRLSSLSSGESTSCNVVSRWQIVSRASCDGGTILARTPSSCIGLVRAYWMLSANSWIAPVRVYSSTNSWYRCSFKGRTTNLCITLSKIASRFRNSVDFSCL